MFSVRHVEYIQFSRVIERDAVGRYAVIKLVYFNILAKHVMVARGGAQQYVRVIKGSESTQSSLALWQGMFEVPNTHV